MVEAGKSRKGGLSSVETGGGLVLEATKAIANAVYKY
jgi:hypothetical protein